MQARVLATLAVAFAAPGCTPCNENGCDFGLVVELRAEIVPLAAGTYELAMHVDGIDWVSTCQVGTSAGTTTCTAASRVDGGPTDVAVLPDVQRMFDGYGQDAAPTGFRLMLLHFVDGDDGRERGGPDRVELQLYRDGELLVDELIEPIYTRSRPFGDPDCGYCDATPPVTIAFE